MIISDNNDNKSDNNAICITNCTAFRNGYFKWLRMFIDLGNGWWLIKLAIFCRKETHLGWR